MVDGKPADNIYKNYCKRKRRYGNHHLSVVDNTVNYHTQSGCRLIYSLAIEAALVGFALFLVMFLLFFRFSPKDSLVVVITPLLFGLRISSKFLIISLSTNLVFLVQ
mgnify:CR=1 FL=1